MADEYWEYDWQYDDPWIIEDVEGDEDYECEGHQQNITNGSAGATPINSTVRSYTEVSGGKIKFGYHTNGTRTVKHTLQAATLISDGTTYRGIIVYGGLDNIVKIGQDLVTPRILIKTGSYYGQTGYLQVITDVIVSKDSGVFWVVEKLPFQSGFCIANRS